MPTASSLNPPTTVTFDSAGEAREHLDILRFRRLPVPGMIQRFAAKSWSDDGTPITVFASGTGLPAEDGSVSYHFVEMGRKAEWRRQAEALRA